MVRYYLLVAIRKMRNNKLFTFINIIGKSISGPIKIAIGWLTISFQSLRGAKTDPAEGLNENNKLKKKSESRLPILVLITKNRTTNNHHGIF